MFPISGTSVRCLGRSRRKCSRVFRGDHEHSSMGRWRDCDIGGKAGVSSRPRQLGVIAVSSSGVKTRSDMPTTACLCLCSIAIRSMFRLRIVPPNQPRRERDGRFLRLGQEPAQLCTVPRPKGGHSHSTSTGFALSSIHFCHGFNRTVILVFSRSLASTAMTCRCVA